MLTMSTAVVVTAGSDAHFVVYHFIYESVLVGDAPGPVASEVILQWLWFADAFIAVPNDVVNEGVNSFEDLPVLRLPPQIVIPRIAVPAQFHGYSVSMSACSTPPPASSRSIASKRRRAFVGERMR